MWFKPTRLNQNPSCRGVVCGDIIYYHHSFWLVFQIPFLEEANEMPEAMFPNILQPKNDGDNGVMCKSFYHNAALKSNKAKNYLTPLERKAIRDLKNITLENKLVNDIEATENRRNASSNKGKLEAPVAKEVASMKRATKSDPTKKASLKQEDYKLSLFDFRKSTPTRVSTPKKSKHASKACTYSWAPNSLKSRYLKAQWKFKSKSIHVPSYKKAESKINRSLPSKSSRREAEQEGCCDEGAKSHSFCDDVYVGDVSLGTNGPPTKMRKMDTLDDNISPPSTLSTSCDSLEETNEKDGPGPTQEVENSDTLASKFYPIFMNDATKPQTTMKKTKASLCENVSPITPGSLLVAVPGRTKARSKKTNENHNKKQLIIDAGQKRFGATHCSMCGMVYSANHPQDEQDHALYHKRILSSIRFTGWKNERLVTSFMDGRIIKVLPNDPKYATKKVTDILTIVDADLGFKTIQAGLSSSKMAYLFVSNDEKIVGCLIAEKISRAFRLLPADAKEESAASADKFICFSASAPTSAVCGVSRIWTYTPMRRKKIATRLLDTLRSTFMLGSMLAINQVAFSDPTPDGRAFATNYFKRPDILVYNNLR